MTGSYRVLALGGDHIGPEVVAAGLELLRHCASRAGIGLEIEEDLLGGASWDVHESFCTDAVLAKARAADAILVGAVGGPEWDNIRIDGPVTETDGLTRLRVELEVYNALRPVRYWPALADHVPFKAAVVEGADILVIRENCGGIYYGEPRGWEDLPDGGQRAFELSEYRTHEVERIARAAFEAAKRRRGRVASLDKSNVMESGKLWRETVTRIGRDEYPEVALDHLLMDHALFVVTQAPNKFDVLLADNLFGDLISDMVGAVAGSLGMLGSATIGASGCIGEKVKAGIYEPTHGSAPDISGHGIANPMGTFLSVGMMFTYAFALPEVERDIEAAVGRVLERGIRTPDISGTATTAEVTEAVIEALG
ncbi:MAG: 3-isopropylmalate dehydrogenase [Pseudomonadota bacterium]